MFYVYILENQAGRHYVGYTKDLEERIKKHNYQSSRWTKQKGPWQVVYIEKYEKKEDAYRREMQIKNYKGGEAFKKLLKI